MKADDDNDIESFKSTNGKKLIDILKWWKLFSQLFNKGTKDKLISLSKQFNFNFPKVQADGRKQVQTNYSHTWENLNKAFPIKKGSTKLTFFRVSSSNS